MNSPLADPEILAKHEQKLLNKVFTLEEMKVGFSWLHLFYQ